MSGPLTKTAYAELVQGDINWLLANTDRTLERDHILAVLQKSVDHEYPEHIDEHPESLDGGGTKNEKVYSPNHNYQT